MARGSVEVRHKSQEYLCVKGILIPPLFFLAHALIIPCIPTGIPTTHLFQTFADVNDGDASGTSCTLRS